MRLRAFNSIGGVRLCGNPFTPGDIGFDSRHDCLEIKVDRKDLSSLALALLQAIGYDASEELIEACRQVVEIESNKD